jgi:hypothetical protein
MKNTKSNTSLTVLTIITGLGIVYYFTKLEWFLWVALALGVLSVASRVIRDLIHFIWMKFADVLGLIIPKIVLGLIFYLILTPLGVISRLISPNELLLTKNNKPSTFIHTDKKFTKEFFEKPW